MVVGSVEAPTVVHVACKVQLVCPVVHDTARGLGRFQCSIIDGLGSLDGLGGGSLSCGVRSGGSGSGLLSSRELELGQDVGRRSLVGDSTKEVVVLVLDSIP